VTLKKYLTKKCPKCGKIVKDHTRFEISYCAARLYMEDLLK